MYFSQTTSGINCTTGTVLEKSYTRAPSRFKTGGVSCSTVKSYAFGSRIPVNNSFGDTVAVEQTHINIRVYRTPIPGYDPIKPAYCAGGTYIGSRSDWSQPSKPA